MNTLFDESVPMGYDQLLGATRNLKKEYDFFQSITIGKTVLGRSIVAYMLGRGRADTIYVGTVHALEYITSMLLVKFAGELCENWRAREPLYDLDIASYLSEHMLYIIPMLNPDGVEIHLRGADTAGPLRAGVKSIAKSDFGSWQANAHGVDLNHNFNAGFGALREEEIRNGITGPSAGRYGGPRAESEPETRALCNLCRRLLFGKAFAFHSQGEQIFWHYGTNTPRNSYEMARMLAAASGYSVDEPEGMAANGGFKDWFISVFSRPGFTVEVGRGVNPLPVESLAPIYGRIARMMTLGLFI